MRRTGILLLVPVLAALLFVEVYPLGYTLYLSLIDFQSKGFVGLSNYFQLLGDSGFWSALLTSLAYASGSTVLAVVLGVLLSFQLVQLSRGRRIVEAVYLAPLALSPVVVGVIWAPSAVWDDFNTFIHFALGLPFLNVTAYGFYFPVMIIADAYEWSPLLMLVSLGIIGSMGTGVVEAAMVHGASPWQVLRRIYLPAILRSPVFSFVVVLRFIDAMRAFEIPFTWSSWVDLPQAGSPADTLSLYLFKLFSVPLYGFPLGMISAVATVLVLVTVVFTLILYRLMTKAVPGL